LQVPLQILLLLLVVGFYHCYFVEMIISQQLAYSGLRSDNTQL
jgi:hypothetical protein